MDTEPFKPPYMSFQTFWNFLADLSAKPLPRKLDRSIMSSKSGTDQNNLMAALETFGFIDGDGTVRSTLEQFASEDNDARKETLALMLDAYYAPAMTVSKENGSPAALNESFRENLGMTSADTRRKAITFFLHAAREANLELSPHFPKTRSGSGSPGTPKARKTPTRRKSTESKTDNDKTDQQREVATTEGRTRRVTLGSGGWVALAYDFDLFDASKEDQEFVLGIVQMLRDYEAAHPTGGGAS